ncbi:MAG: hypothetical protein ACREAE_06680, partial [Nitrosopumilaceae archaeon]
NLLYYYKNFCKDFSRYIENIISKNILIVLIIDDELNFSLKILLDADNQGKTYIVGLSVME